MAWRERLLSKRCFAHYPPRARSLRIFCPQLTPPLPRSFSMPERAKLRDRTSGAAFRYFWRRPKVFAKALLTLVPAQLRDALLRAYRQRH